MNKNVVKFSILDSPYVIKSDDSEKYVINTAKQVEDSIKILMRDYRSLSAMSAAVLTALDFCDKSQKANSDADNLRAQLKECLEESSSSRIDLDDARNEIERLKKELNMLRARVSSDGTSSHEKKEKQASKATAVNSTASSPIKRESSSKSKSQTVVKSTNKKDPRDEIMSFFDKE